MHGFPGIGVLTKLLVLSSALLLGNPQIQILETTASEENAKCRINSRGLDTDFSIFKKEQPGIPVAADPIEVFL